MTSSIAHMSWPSILALPARGESTTPAYGTWCENSDGRLVHLSDELSLQGEQLPEYACNGNGPTVYILPEKADVAPLRPSGGLLSSR